MSLRLSSRKKPRATSRGSRPISAQRGAALRARRAATRMAPTAGQARRIAAVQIRTARGWGAPQLHRAARFFELRFGPGVGAMLHRIAWRIELKKSRSRRGMGAVLLFIGGALGTAGAIATRRKAARSAEEAAPTAPADLSAVSGAGAEEHARSY